MEWQNSGPCPRGLTRYRQQAACRPCVNYQEAVAQGLQKVALAHMVERPRRQHRACIAQSRWSKHTTTRNMPTAIASGADPHPQAPIGDEVQDKDLHEGAGGQSQRHQAREAQGGEGGRRVATWLDLLWALEEGVGEVEAKNVGLERGSNARQRLTRPHALLAFPDAHPEALRLPRRHVQVGVLRQDLVYAPWETPTTDRQRVREAT